MAKERPRPRRLWGLALRAAGAGLRVYIAQFVKGMKYSEISTLAKLLGFIAVKQYGRTADPRIIEVAKLVTEMKEIKHYYQKGVEAREGIEK